MGGSGGPGRRDTAQCDGRHAAAGCPPGELPRGGVRGCLVVSSGRGATADVPGVNARLYRSLHRAADFAQRLLEQHPPPWRLHVRSFLPAPNGAGKLE